MKKLLLLVPVALTSCKTVWKAPAVESSENNAPRVVAVAFCDTATVVEMEKAVGYGFRIGDEAMIVSEKMRVAGLRWTENLPQLSDWQSDETVRFRLGFDALGKGVKRLDFSEGAGEKDYRIWGIRPKGKGLAEHEYNPTRIPIEGDGRTLLTNLLERHKGKVVMLQFVDMTSDESIATLRRSEAVRKQFSDDPRVSFVFLARPDSKEYEEGTQSAILVGTAACMEFISPTEYNTLLALLQPYMPKDRVLSLDQNLQILSPGLLYNSPQLFGRQLEILFLNGGGISQKF